MTSLSANDSIPTNYHNRWLKKPKPLHVIDTSTTPRDQRKARRGDVAGCMSVESNNFWKPETKVKRVANRTLTLSDQRIVPIDVPQDILRGLKADKDGYMTMTVISSKKAPDLGYICNGSSTKVAVVRNHTNVWMTE